ncbi:MAG: hypothetical protein HY720_23495, partial [Planctomycetes bacterium]|nr:hypothetical protein [Planctomycetota bacterium]
AGRRATGDGRRNPRTPNPEPRRPEEGAVPLPLTRIGRRFAGLLLLLFVAPCGAESLDGWLLLSDGTKVEGRFAADRRELSLRDVFRGERARVPVEEIRRIRVYAVDERRLRGSGPEGGEIEAIQREYIAQIETASGDVWFSHLEFRLRLGEGEERKTYVFTRFQRGSAGPAGGGKGALGGEELPPGRQDGAGGGRWGEAPSGRSGGQDGRSDDENGPPHFLHVELAVFGPAAMAPEESRAPVLAGKLDPTLGYRRAFAILRSMDLVVEGRIVEEGKAYRFDDLLPGEYDLVLAGRETLDLWLAPRPREGLLPEEDEAALSGLVKAVASREETAAGGRQVRHALARGRPQCARAVVLEERWRTVLTPGREPEYRYEERTYWLYFARDMAGWRVDRAVLLDQAAAPEGGEAPLAAVRLDERLAGVRIGLLREPVRLDLAR